MSCSVSHDNNTLFHSHRLTDSSLTGSISPEHSATYIWYQYFPSDDLTPLIFASSSYYSLSRPSPIYSHLTCECKRSGGGVVPHQLPAARNSVQREIHKERSETEEPSREQRSERDKRGRELKRDEHISTRTCTHHAKFLGFINSLR